MRQAFRRSASASLAITCAAIGVLSANAAAAPPPQTCTQPTSVNAFAIGGSAVTVLWGPLGCAYYTAYAFSYDGTPEVLPVAYEGGAVVGGLTAGDSYTFTVIGYDAGTAQWTGWSGWSSWAVVTSGGMTPLFDGSTLN